MSLYSPIIRGFVFWLSFLFTLSIGIGGIAYAANSGGKFGEMLNKILVTAWDSTTNDGTVKNSAKFNNMEPASFVTAKANQSCGSNKCIVGFESDGTVKCSN
jgi:hypothetical protein